MTGSLHSWAKLYSINKMLHPYKETEKLPSCQSSQSIFEFKSLQTHANTFFYSANCVWFHFSNFFHLSFHPNSPHANIHYHFASAWEPIFIRGQLNLSLNIGIVFSVHDISILGRQAQAELIRIGPKAVVEDKDVQQYLFELSWDQIKDDRSYQTHTDNPMDLQNQYLCVCKCHNSTVKSIVKELQFF